MKKSMKRKDLDLKLIFDGLIGDAFDSDLAIEIKKLDIIIQNEEGKITNAFGFYKREIK